MMMGTTGTHIVPKITIRRGPQEVGQYATIQELKNNVRASFHDALSPHGHVHSKKGITGRTKLNHYGYHHPVLTALFAGVGATRLKLLGQ